MNCAGFTYTWHQDLTDPFDEAEFYENGPIVTVRLGSLAISVDRDGVALWTSIVDADLTVIEEPSQFREQFPDGKIPADSEGWTVTYNGWFDLYDATEGRSEDPNDLPVANPSGPRPAVFGENGHLDNVAYSLKEAIADAERILTDAPKVDPE